jgi:hypothetical protein
MTVVNGAGQGTGKIAVVSMINVFVSFLPTLYPFRLTGAYSVLLKDFLLTPFHTLSGKHVLSYVKTLIFIEAYKLLAEG